jgi:anti-anti-sigma regulatory factor
MSGVTSHTVELSGTLGVRDAALLALRLAAAIEAHPSVTVSAAALEGLDIAIVQVLVAARKSAARAGRQLTIVPGPALVRTLVKAGFLTADGSPATPEGAFWHGAGTGFGAGKEQAA